MKRKRTGFTVVEILTVVTIIAILLGVLIPALSMVRNFAKETRQKAQFVSIELALLAFRNDYGDYPPSEGVTLPPPALITDYCGAQKLAEALVGWDLLGFHPKSAWRADGYDGPGSGPWTYDPDRIRSDDTFAERKGPYLELDTANAFRLQDLFDVTGTPLETSWERYVLCDTYEVKLVVITGPTGQTATSRAGTPILYYRANTASRYELDSSVPLQDQPYNSGDNVALINLGSLTPRGAPGERHKLVNIPSAAPDDVLFYEYIMDPKLSSATNRRLPYKPDSYILISAGRDGLYGTEDDITNFGN